MERFAKAAALALSAVLESPVQSRDLETPPDPTLGDFGFPCFKLAKQYRKAPPQVAQQITESLISKGQVPDGMTVAAVGPYVNFTAPAGSALKALLKDILNGPGLGTYGQLEPKSRGTWVLEYSSPNVAKTLNIYHLRPTALGAALDRIGRYRGFNVISINHLGDWGKQYGMLAVAFKIYGISLDAKLSLADLVDLYVRVNADATAQKKENQTGPTGAPSIEDQARSAFLKLEQGDPEMTAFWKKCVDVSMLEFNRIYKRLGVSFDHIWGESFYKDQLQPLLADLRARNLLVESEGAWVVPVTDDAGRELPPCIMEKSDGATIYATRDVAAAIYRYQQFRFDRMTYIVGGEQRLHFQQIFAVLKKMELPWASRCEHVPFGLYRFKDTKMSTRKGNFVTLEEILTVAKERVSELMRDRAAKLNSDPANPASPASAVGDEAVTEAIAVGAVVFHDLHNDPARDIEFDVERVVDFEGETGPYLQYAHTRCLSILRKADRKVTYDESLIPLLTRSEELALVKTLGQLPIHLERTLVNAKASQLAHYLIDVTKAFGTFYRECHVLTRSPGEDPNLTQARLMLVEATRRVLARGLGLLLIPLPERM